MPFGEYVPFKSVLFFVGPLVESVSDFSPGDEIVMLPVAGHLASTAICYEIVYPSLIRQAVGTGSELLTTITNDAWYGHSSAPYQHFEQAAMRAIEEGRYLVRAANTGISGIVDPYGRVVAQTNLFERAALVGECEVPDGTDAVQPDWRSRGVRVGRRSRLPLPACCGERGAVRRSRAGERPAPDWERETWLSPSMNCFAAIRTSPGARRS